MARDFELIVYGASGYTGALVAEYLATAYPAGVRWAMAGRSLTKLQAVRDAIGAPADLPLITANADDPASLHAMAARADVVISTVGPYQLHGREMIAACVDAGTAYVDLCGEPAWMREMIDAHHARAAETGARIVFSCGFDSIPFDLGVLTLQQAAIAKYGRPAPRVKGRVRVMKGGFSGGTAASLKATLAAAARNPSIIALLTNPFALTPGFEGPGQPTGLLPEYDRTIEAWVAPFIMAPINTKNVHRTNFLLNHLYSKDFVYDEMVVAGLGDMGKAAAEALAKINPLSGDKGPKPGEGPTREERDAGHYDLLFVGEMGGKERIDAVVTGDKDPGYGSTSKMITEAALCLARDVPDAAGGVWTPGAIMGEPLRKRLIEHAGLRFTAGGARGFTPPGGLASMGGGTDGCRAPCYRRPPPFPLKGSRTAHPRCRARPAARPVRQARLHWPARQTLQDRRRSKAGSAPSAGRSGTPECPPPARPRNRAPATPIAA